jgi:hypothetical protein
MAGTFLTMSLPDWSAEGHKRSDLNKKSRVNRVGTHWTQSDWHLVLLCGDVTPEYRLRWLNGVANVVGFVTESNGAEKEEH